MEISQKFVDTFEAIAEQPSSLTKTTVVEEADVITLTEPEAFTGEALPSFLQGKHFIVATLQRGKEVEVVSLIAESVKTAMKAAGIKPVKTKGKWELPSMRFSANGYKMKFEKN